MKAKFEFDLTAGSEDQYYYAMYSSAPSLTEVYSELRDLRRNLERRYESNTIDIESLVKMLDEVLDKSGIHEELYS
tara:strand:+ start:285 stop:512 length:228 start_codon:yes stop_codon:yes gene_type:complete